jgi:outer membrane protein assembly factor BamB
LRACERLYGCTAARVARGLLETAEEELSPQPTTREQKTASERKRIDPLLAELRAARKGPANRELEERVARALLQAGRALPSEVIARLRQEAALLCRQEDLRWILQYVALNPLAELAGYGTNEDEAIDACLAFSRSDAPRPLRAGAAALAAQAGLGARDPVRALQLLRPFRRPDVFRPHPTLSWLRSLPQQSSALPLDPEPLMARVAQNLVSPACTQTFQQGDWKHFAALQADLLPDDHTSRGVRLLFSAFSEQPNAPLRLFVEANGQERRRGARAAAAAFTALSRHYSTARIAPYALWRAQGCAERAKDPGYAARLRAELTARFPNSYPATAAQVREAVEQWAPETVPPLAPRVLAEGARLRDLEFYLHLPTPDSLQSELDRVTKAVQQVSPLLEPGQKPVLIRQLQTIHNQAALEQQVAKLFPKQQPEVYLRLMEVELLSSLAEPFLRRYPDHPEAKKAWDRLYSGSLTQLLPWLAPLVERGSSYRWEQQARRLLERLVVRDGWSDENEMAYLSWVREQAAQVREACPRSRAEAIADLAVARTLLRAQRPEDALSLLRSLRTHLTDRDLLAIDHAELTRWATLEISAKQLPDWEPRWHAQVQLPKFSGAPGANKLPSATPVAGGGILVVPVSLGEDVTGIAALEEETGKVRWRTPTGYPTSLAMGNESLIYVGTARGTVVGIAAADGRILFERKVDPKAAGTTRVAFAADALLAWSAGKLFGLAETTGEPLWSMAVDLLPGRLSVQGGAAFLAAGTGTVIAVDVRSGRTVWIRDYSKPKPEFSLVSAQPTLGEGALGVRVGDDIVLLDPADGHTRYSIQRDQANSEYLTGVSDADFTLVLPGHVSGTFIQSRDGILSARDAPEGVLDRGVVYGNERDGRLAVTDVASNARLRGSNQPGSTFRWAAFAQHAYFITDSGAVSAFPRVEAPPVGR